MEIKIEDWNKKIRLSKSLFTFVKMFRKSITYCTEDCRYFINADLKDNSEIENKMTANNLFSQCSHFSLEKIY